nr:hypothetical protein [uncultured Flavobacterium sp.]
MKTPHEKRVEEVEKKLKEVTGKAVFFKDKIITIKSFKVFTTAVTIITDETSFSLELHLVEKYLDELSGEIPATFTPIDAAAYIDHDEPVKHKFPPITPEQLKTNEKMENQKSAENNQPVQQNQALATTQNLPEASDIEISGYRPTQENVQIKQALMGMLSKVSASSSAIPQAKAVCDIANTMVNIQKNEITMIQMVNRKKS